MRLHGWGLAIGLAALTALALPAAAQKADTVLKWGDNLSPSLDPHALSDVPAAFPRLNMYDSLLRVVGNPPKIETRAVKGKNVEVTRAETHGEYHPAQFPGQRAEPVRKNARLLGAIIMGDEAGYYIRMVGPDKTMKKLAPDFDELLKTLKVGS